MALRRVLLTLAAIAALAALAGCDSRDSRDSRERDPAVSVARDLLREIFDRSGTGAPDAPPDLRAVFTRDLIDQAATPLVYVQIDSIQARAILWPVATNGPDETWRGEDALTLTLSREGVLRATRGFIHDLHASDIEGTRRALATARAGRVSRLAIRLGGDLAQIRTSHACDIGFGAPEAIAIFGETRRLTPATERCIETATGDAGFENRYWIDAAGLVWVSDQWAGAELGHVHIERLYR